MQASRSDQGGARRRIALVLVALAVFGPGVAHADDTAIDDARKSFEEGTDHVKKAEWAKALAAFETSAARKPHAITTYNIAACQRAIGAYTRARATFAAALKQDEAAGSKELPDSLRVAAKGFVAEIDQIVAHVKVTLSPPDAHLAVDGAPLSPGEGPGGQPVLVAGLAAPASGSPPPSPAFDLVLDPGPHVLVLSRKGFQEVALARTVAPGSSTTWNIELDKLPGLIHVASNREQAIVKVAGADVGAVPVDVSRPAGSYKILVTRDGFVPYDADVTLHAGEEVTLQAELPPLTTPIYKRWWFWGAAAAITGGVVVGTYFATRPPPTRPALDGGGLGWTVPLK